MTAVFEARDVRKTFTIRQGLFKPKKPLHAVNGVSFKLDRGSVLGLVGESQTALTPDGKVFIRGEYWSARADEEIAAGDYRGPLHGIPWGLKDLLAVRGTKTTWGMTPFQDRVIDVDSTVYERLTESGAVLVAKLSTGALAVGARCRRCCAHLRIRPFSGC